MFVGGRKWCCLWCLYGMTIFMSGYAGSDVSKDDRIKDEIPQGASSLTFVFDITGSMWDELTQVTEGVEQLLATVLARKEKVVYNYVLVPFHDPDIGPVTVTTDTDEFLARLADLHVYGGGDCPEMSVSAIKLALDVSLPHSFIYVFTDARAKDYVLLEEVLKLIQKKESQVVFVLTGDCGNNTHPGYLAYERIASTSSGQVFHLEESDVNEVLNFTRATLQARKVNLLAVDRKQNFGEDIQFTVDKSLVEFTISVAGNNTNVFLENPGGQRASDTEDLTVLLALSNVQIMSIKDPSPGLWKLRVTSEGPHTVRATGLSQLNFVHGFSNGSITNLEETKHRPVKGSQTSLLVKAVSSDEQSAFQAVELVGLNGEQLNFFPLYSLTSGPNPVYSTPPFYPPDGYFYLRVSGADPRGQTFQRITPTALNAELPNFPEVYMPSLVTAYNNESLTLRCSIRSQVPYSVSWYMNLVPMYPEEKHTKSRDVQIHFPTVTNNTRGMYSCKASNVAGTADSTTYLDVKVALPPILDPPSNVSSALGQDVGLHCRATSPLHSIKFTWNRIQEEGEGGRKSLAPLRSDSRPLPNGTLLLDSVQPSDQGWYRCTASSRGGTTNSDLYLSVLEKPNVQISFCQYIVRPGETVVLGCPTSGVPSPVVQWMKGSQEIVPLSYTQVTPEGSLHILGVQEVDAGEYTCLARNSAGQDSGRMRLEVGVPATVVQVPEFVPVAIGSSVSISCVAAGSLPIQVIWRREPHVPLQQIDGVLHIQDAQLEHEGLYVCAATNDYGQQEKSMKVTITGIVAPTMLPVDSPAVTSLINRGAMLPCGVQGNPPPQIRWYLQDRLIDLDDPSYILHPNGSLEIRGTSEHHQGHYTCVAENVGGNATQAMNFTVLVPPVLNDPTSKSISSLEGTASVLSCESHGIPPSTILWYKDGERLGPSSHRSQSAKGILRIDPTNENDSGTYVCTATNMGSVSEKHFTLYVQVPPRILGEPNLQENMVQGRPVTLRCDVRAVPAPVVQWSKDGSPLNADSHFQILSSGNIHLDHVRLSDAGVYVCVASNSIGEVSRQITLIIFGVPDTMNNVDDRISVQKGDQIEIPCMVTGFPEPQIHWTKDDKLIKAIFAQIICNFGDYALSDTDFNFKVAFNNKCYFKTSYSDVDGLTFTVPEQHYKCMYPNNGDDCVIKCSSENYDFVYKIGEGQSCSSNDIVCRYGKCTSATDTSK